MNPLTSILGTIISGFVLAAVIVLALSTGSLNIWALEVWFHVLAGIPLHWEWLVLRWFF